MTTSSGESGLLRGSVLSLQAASLQIAWFVIFYHSSEGWA